MQIRQLGLQDAEAYLSIILEALQNDPASFEEEKEQTAEKYRNRFAVLFL